MAARPREPLNPVRSASSSDIWPSDIRWERESQGADSQIWSVANFDEWISLNSVVRSQLCYHDPASQVRGTATRTWVRVKGTKSCGWLCTGAMMTVHPRSCLHHVWFKQKSNFISGTWERHLFLFCFFKLKLSLNNLKSHLGSLIFTWLFLHLTTAE